MMTGQREQQLIEAANALLNARRTATPIADLPAVLQPATLDEAYFVQDTMAVAYKASGTDSGGWKVGAPSLDATPIFAPMPRAWIAPSDSTIAGTTSRYRGLEAEIAFLLGKDLPARSTPYTREEIADAIASCHPAIEILESGLIDPMTATRMSMLGDLQMHGGFIYGPAVPDWQSIDFHTEAVALSVDGAVRVDRVGSNTSGDLMRLLPWLASHAAARTGGLRAGQWITTGSWTGNVQTTAGTTVEVHFANAGRAAVRFA